MAHYNLYDTLGLDRSASTSDLRGELDSRLATGPFDNPGGEEEVKLASNILGDERKREVYDKRLGELDAEPITVPALRQLAEMNLDGPGAAQQASSSKRLRLGQAKLCGGPRRRHLQSPRPGRGLQEHLHPGHRRDRRRGKPGGHHLGRYFVLAAVRQTQVVQLSVWAPHQESGRGAAHANGVGRLVRVGDVVPFDGAGITR